MRKSYSVLRFGALCIPFLVFFLASKVWAQQVFDDYFFGRGANLVYVSTAELRLGSFERVRISLFQFSGNGRLEFSGSRTETCSYYLSWSSASQHYISGRGPDTALYKVFPLLAPSGCPQWSHMQLLSSGSMSEVSFAFGSHRYSNLAEVFDSEASIQMVFDSMATESEYEIARGPCGHARFGGLLVNVGDLFLCDATYAITQLRQGRILSLGLVTDAQIVFRGGATRATVTRRYESRLNSARQYMVSCIFDDQTAAIYADGLGFFFASLVEASEQHFVFECSGPTPGQLNEHL